LGGDARSGSSPAFVLMAIADINPDLLMFRGGMEFDVGLRIA
jgi:hypothetical protein